MNEQPAVVATTAASDDALVDPRKARHLDTIIGGPDFGRLLEGMRELQDRFVAASPPLGTTVRMGGGGVPSSGRHAQRPARTRQCAAGTRDLRRADGDVRSWPGHVPPLPS